MQPITHSFETPTCAAHHLNLAVEGWSSDGGVRDSLGQMSCFASGKEKKKKKKNHAGSLSSRFHFGNNTSTQHRSLTLAAVTYHRAKQFVNKSKRRLSWGPTGSVFRSLCSVPFLCAAHVIQALDGDVCFGHLHHQLLQWKHIQHGNVKQTYPLAACLAGSQLPAPSNQSPAQHRGKEQ